MPFEVVDHLTIDGYRYHFRNFKRFSIPVELPQLQAVRIQPPNIDFEVQSFEGGITVADGDATGNYLRDTLGMEPTGPTGAASFPWRRVGKQLIELGTNPTINGFDTVMPFKLLLIAGRDSNGEVYSWNGSAWTLEDTLPAAAQTFVQVGNAIVAYHAGSANWSWDANGTGTWTDVTAASGGTNCYAAVGLVGGASHRPCVFRIIDNQVRFSDDITLTTETLICTLPDLFSYGGMVTDGSTLYFSSSDPVAGSHIWSLGVSATAADPRLIGRIQDNFPVSTAYYHGDVYFGMRYRGEVYVADGNSVRLERTLPDCQDNYEGVRLTVLNDSLYAVYGSAATAGRLYVWRLDGDAWSQAHYGDVGGTLTTINAVAAYNQRLVIAMTNAGSGLCMFEVSAGTYLQTGQLELPDVVYGAPAIRKGYVLGRLQHSALLPGQSIQLSHKLNNSTVETTDGTNADVGSVETIIPFPNGTVGTRLRPKWHLNAASSTAGSTNTITAYSAGVRATPLPEEREVWTADLALTNSVYNDGTTDTRDALDKYERLLELKRSGRMFQMVDPFRESSATTLPRAAMMAKLDAQIPLEWDAAQLASNQGGADIRVPIRISQALGDVVGPLNLDFENDAAGTSGANITGWTQSPTTSSGAASISTAQFKSGAKSLALTFSGTPTLYAETQTITGLVGGRYYTVGGYIKRQLSAGMVYIEVSSTGLGVRTDELTSATDADFDWYERTFQLPAANTAFTIKCQGSSAGGAMPTGTVWFDGIRHQE